MLALVIADGHLLDFVEQNVGCHQHGVGEEAGAVTVLALGLLFELGHATKFTEGGDVFQQSRQLRVIGHVALDEQSADLGVESAGEQRSYAVNRLLEQYRWFDLQGQRV
jgi:hypothetical protein